MDSDVIAGEASVGEYAAWESQVGVGEMSVRLDGQERIDDSFERVNFWVVCNLGV